MIYSSSALAPRSSYNPRPTPAPSLMTSSTPSLKLLGPSLSSTLYRRPPSRAGLDSGPASLSSTLVRPSPRRAVVNTDDTDSPSPRTVDPITALANSSTPGFRSNSAIDVNAARRAQARAAYASVTRMKAGSGVSLRE